LGSGPAFSAKPFPAHHTSYSHQPAGEFVVTAQSVQFSMGPQKYLLGQILGMAQILRGIEADGSYQPGVSLIETGICGPITA